MQLAAEPEHFGSALGQSCLPPAATARSIPISVVGVAKTTSRGRVVVEIWDLIKGGGEEHLVRQEEHDELGCLRGLPVLLGGELIDMRPDVAVRSASTPRP